MTIRGYWHRTLIFADYHDRIVVDRSFFVSLVGGGIECHAIDLSVSHSFFAYNCNLLGGGGGIYVECRQNSNLELSDTCFINNSARDQGQSFSMWADQDRYIGCTISVARTTIYGCTTGFHSCIMIGGVQTATHTNSTHNYNIECAVFRFGGIDEDVGSRASFNSFTNCESKNNAIMIGLSAGSVTGKNFMHRANIVNIANSTNAMNVVRVSSGNCTITDSNFIRCSRVGEFGGVFYAHFGTLHFLNCYFEDTILTVLTPIQGVGIFESTADDAIDLEIDIFSLRCEMSPARKNTIVVALAFAPFLTV